MSFEIDASFEGSFFKCFYDIIFIVGQEKIFPHHNVLLPTYSFLHFQKIEIFLLIKASGPL